MKTLIIDNYDSFTFNLYHLFWRATGEAPWVIRHDDPGWTPAWLEQVEQVVVSPGPGSPLVDADLGIARDVIAGVGPERPILGICLGHQAICHHAGARVGLAPEPMHGRVQRLRHVVDPLFAEIPERFEIVRYHSLAATELPDALAPLAWTDDGVLMAVAHRHRPQWGVQFHPESVSAQYGEQLVRNFCRLAEAFNRAAGTTVRSRPVEAARSALLPATVPARRFDLRWRLLTTATDPVTAFCALYGDTERAIWLDSNEPQSERATLSLMGDASGEHGRWAHADVTTGRLEVGATREAGTQVFRSGFFDWLEHDLAAIELVEHDDGPPFEARPGWFGHLGYELKAECGGDAVHEAPLPDAAMLFVDRLVAFDHTSGRAYAMALCKPDDAASERRAHDWFDSLDAILIRSTPVETSPTSSPCPSGHALALRHSPETYARHIDACQREIRRGETYEVCLTNALTFELAPPADSLLIYRLLRQSNPTAFSSFIRWPGWSVLSVSPERFLRIGRDRVAESRPMKGTRRRSPDPAEDRRLREDLARNEKDRAENLMIVDLVRHDLGRGAVADGVRAEPLFDVETYARVHQLVSTVRARLRSDVSAVRCVRNAFPGGSMTGAPKVRTMQIIDRLEGGARGIYSGAIGYFALNGTVDLSIVIRTLVMSGRQLTLGTGGAIIALSDPEAELAETALKARALLEPFGLDFPSTDQSPTSGQHTGLPFVR